VRLYSCSVGRTGSLPSSLGPDHRGLRGQLYIFDRDIFTVEMEEIDQTVVQQTWIRVEKVYERQ
jgi:predicted amidohydrolase YtcJ